MSAPASNNYKVMNMDIHATLQGRDARSAKGKDQGIDKLHSVTELARELGVTPRTLRFYEDKGLLSPQRLGTTRAYTHRDRVRMILILRGKRMGFSLREIKEFLDLYVVDHSNVRQMQHLLKKVRGRIKALEEQLLAVQTSLKELRDMEQVSIDALHAKGLAFD